MAVLCAGGSLLGGVGSRPRRKRRWCVLRSPHIDKKSREHFHMITNFRSFRWSVGPDAESSLAMGIAEGLPPNVATRVTETMPGLLALPKIYETLQKSRETTMDDEPQVGKDEESKQDTSREE